MYSFPQGIYYFRVIQYFYFFEKTFFRNKIEKKNVYPCSYALILKDAWTIGPPLYNSLQGEMINISWQGIIFSQLEILKFFTADENMFFRSFGNTFYYNFRWNNSIWRLYLIWRKGFNRFQRHWTYEYLFEKIENFNSKVLQNENKLLHFIWKLTAFR